MVNGAAFCLQKSTTDGFVPNIPEAEFLEMDLLRKILKNIIAFEEYVTKILLISSGGV